MWIFHNFTKLQGKKQRKRKKNSAPRDSSSAKVGRRQIAVIKLRRAAATAKGVIVVWLLFSQINGNQQQL
jgi:hypothetical protein